jgi:hypothetical protein
VIPDDVCDQSVHGYYDFASIATGIEEPTEFRKICDRARSRCRESVDIWTFPLDKIECRGLLDKLALAIGLHSEDGRSCFNEVLEC